MKKIGLKKFASLLLTLFLFISMVNPVCAEDNSIKVQLNGEKVLFEVEPRMINNRVLVPMRTIFERLGADVQWDGQNRVVTAKKAGTVVELAVDSRNASITKNGEEKKIQLDVSPIIVKGKTLVPVRFIAESLGVQVGWDQANKTVILIDYRYFLEALKTEAPNFYEFVSNQYEVINTGEVNDLGNFSLKFASSIDPSAVISAAVDTNVNTKMNEDSGSVEAAIKLIGWQEILRGSGLENIDKITFDARFDNNSIYFKSNLFTLLEQYKVIIGEKWIKADIADLDIPNVNTLEDLKEMQSRPMGEQVLESFINTPMELDVNSFAQAKAVINGLITLVDDEHFTVTNKGDVSIYSWSIEKQDLIDFLLSVQKNFPSSQDITMKDLLDIKRFADTLVFDFNMEVTVKNNIIVSTKSSLNMQMDIPDFGHLELSAKGDSQVRNPNNAYFKIEIPNQSNVIDFEDLVNSRLEQTSQY